jgi:hypothetical protein
MITTQFDNPFLTRELRQFKRQKNSTNYWLIGCLGIMGLAIALQIYLLVDNSGTIPETNAIPESVYRWWLIIPHVLLCVVAAYQGSKRVFADEYRQSTLIDVLTLPYLPGQWLALKYTFSLYLLGIAWLAGLPFYLAAALTQAISFQTLSRSIPISLLAGLVTLLLSLLLPPGYVEQWQKPGEKDTATATTGKAVTPGDTLARNLLCGAILIFIFVLWFRGAAPWLEWRRFYVIFVPEGYLWISVMPAVIWACVQSAMSVVIGTEAAERRAMAFRWSALFLVYYATLGVLWNVMTVRNQWMGVLAFPILLFIVHRVTWHKAESPGEENAIARNIGLTLGAAVQSKGNSREDPLAEAEIRWFGARWDNPLLVKDLRVYSRSSSLRLSALVSVIAVGAMVALFYRLLPQLPWGVVFAMMTGAFSRPGVLAIAQWTKEFKGCTLGLLLISPLSTREILMGRFWSSWVYGLASGLGGLLLAFGVFAWGVTQWPWTIVPVALALSPIIVTSNLQQCCTVPNLDIPNDRGFWSVDNSFFFVLLQAVIFLACIALAFSKNYLPAFVIVVLAICFFAINVVLSKTCFRLCLRKLDRYRSGDIAMTGDESKAAEPKMTKLKAKKSFSWK